MFPLEAVAFALDPVGPGAAGLLATVALPPVARVGSKPGMVLALVTGVLLAVIALGLSSTAGVDDPGILVVAVPAAFLLGFFLVGAGIAVRRFL